jgi:mycofactocin precursor
MTGGMMDKRDERQNDKANRVESEAEEEPLILEEIDIEEIHVDGICGVY